MAVTATAYGAFYTDLLQGVHNINSDSDKVALLASSYTPNFGTHAAFSDLSTAEVSGAGYTQGGVALTSRAVAYNAATKTMTLSAQPVSWTALTATCRYAVIYKATGTSSTSKLIGLIDFGQDRTYAGEPLQVSFPSGVLTIAAGS